MRNTERGPVASTDQLTKRLPRLATVAAARAALPAAVGLPAQNLLGTPREIILGTPGAPRSETEVLFRYPTLDLWVTADGAGALNIDAMLSQSKGAAPFTDGRSQAFSVVTVNGRPAVYQPGGYLDMGKGSGNPKIDRSLAWTLGSTLYELRDTNMKVDVDTLMQIAQSLN